MRDEQGLVDTAYQITAYEVTAIKKEIAHVLRHELVTPTMSTPKNVGKGMLKYEYSTWKQVRPPRWTLDFGRGDVASTSKEATTLKFIGLDYDMHFTMPQMDMYANSNRGIAFSESLQQGTLRELTASLAQYREWALFRGSDIPNFTDTGLTGLCNNASVTDPGALGLGGDDNLTAAGDVYHSAIVMANELINAKFKPPFVLHMTPGVFSQALKNKTGTPLVSDFQLIAEYGAKEGKQIFSDIIMNPYLIDSETETTSTGAMMVVKEDSMNFEPVESYPLGFYALPSVDLGFDGKLLWCGGMAVYRPAAVVYADALTIDSL